MAQSVRWHLLLPQVATRRDIGDPAVVAEVASPIGDPQLVRMLALLAVADAQGNGKHGLDSLEGVVDPLADRAAAG